MAIWDSLYIYYISGTGNAKLSAEWFAGEAVKSGIPTVVQRIDRLEGIQFPTSGKNNLIGFAFPTHGFNAAPLMLKFIARLPKGLGKDVFLMNTRAGMKISKIFLNGISGLALAIPAFLLLLKGYRCIGFRPVDMPSNWISLHPGIKNSVVESIFGRCEPIVRRFAARVLSGEKVYRGLFSLPFDMLLSPITAGYYFGGRFLLAKSFIASSKCNNCGICIKECPTASIIYVRERPFWKLTCESCMRCMNICPQRAIESAHGLITGIMFLVSAVNAWLLMTILEYLKISPEAFWWKLLSQIIGIGVMVLIAASVYLAIHYASGFSPLRFILRFTSLTTYPFWRRYRFFRNKLKQKDENIINMNITQ